MSSWIRLVVFVGLLIGCIHGEQQQMQDLGLGDSSDLATDVKSLQKNVTDLWTYIYQLRQAIEQHLTELTRRQSRLENSLQHQTMHSVGGHDYHGHDHHSGDHGDSSHRHEPLTSGGDHHDEHGSDHHHDEHGSDHHHDEHGSDHHHDEHGSDHHHDEHGSSSSGHHDEEHHHDSHSTGDHQHGDDQHSHHDEHHHGHHSSSESHTDEHHHGHHSTSESHSHTDEHSNHTDADHSHGHDEHHHHHGDDHHDSHETVDTAHGQHQHSHEHKESHEKQDKVPDEQQSVEDIEKPFTATVVQPHHGGDLTSGSLDKAEDPNRSDPLNLLGRHDHHHHHHHHHHSHQDQAQQSYETKVTIPKFSEYRQYIFATCDVQPNRVLSPELQQEVKGQVSFWQKKSGGPLNIHVRLRGFSIGDHHGHQQQQQEQSNEPPVHEAGHRHGMHVHEFGDLSAGCQSTGAHYNPFNVNHGGPRAEVRHVGDLGNIECDDHGVTNLVFPDSVASLTGQHSIVGKALVIHSDVDDLGLNEDVGSQTTGNAGVRIACCVIQAVEKLPLSTFKSIKSATNYQN